MKQRGAANPRINHLWDSHVHLFPDQMMRAVYKFFRERYSWRLPFPSDPAALLGYLRRQGVHKAFVLAYVHRPDLSREINRWLAGLAADHHWLVPFGSVHPQDRDLPVVLKEALDRYRFPGLKLHCLVQQLRPDDERLFPVYEAVLERSRGIIVHAGSFPLPDPDLLGHRYVARVMQRYPKLKIIIPHLGLNDLEEYRSMLAEYPGLYLDTSFVFQNAGFIPPLEKIKALLTDFPERIIYGSDFPFILEPPEHGIRRILELALPQQAKRNLFSGNAQAFLQSLSPFA